MADERDTPIPGDPVTRDLRRAVYLVGAVDATLVDTAAALGVAIDPDDSHAPLEDRKRTQAARSALALHLGRAWDDGCSREIDLRTSLVVIRGHVELLQRKLSEQTHLVQFLTYEVEQMRKMVGELRAEIREAGKRTDSTGG